jgi:hypothetical protein
MRVTSDEPSSFKKPRQAPCDFKLEGLSCGKVRTPLRVIRSKCLDCAGSAQLVKACRIETCPLWSYRFGHDPKLRGRVNAGSFRPKRAQA